MPDTRHLSGTLPNGDAGTFAMVRRMVEIASASARLPQVRAAAVSIVRYLPPRDYDAQIRTLRDWLAGRVSFLRDPMGVELSYAPSLMLDSVRKFGIANVDCDDAAVLAATLALAIGLRARYVVVGFVKPNAVFSHVWTEVSSPVREQWYEMDVTRQAREIPVHLISRKFVTEVRPGVPMQVPKIIIANVTNSAREASVPRVLSRRTFGSTT